MQQSRRPRHLHADVDFDLDESETPGIETPPGPRIMSPRAVNANSRRILNRLTDNRKLTESTEFKTEDGGGVLVLRTAKRQFDVVRYRKREGSQRRAVQLAVLFIVKGTGDFYPVRYSVDPPREPDLTHESISTQSPDEYEQHELAKNMDDWLPNVERSIDGPPVAQAG